MTKPTPGPWTFDEHGGTWFVWGPGQAMVADGDAGEGHIARMRGVGRGATDEEQEANARLIAAAPEMLEALRIAAARLASVEGAEQTVSNVAVAAALMPIRAAIAKAEGR